MKYQMHIRSQHRKVNRYGFGGPDTYVAVTISPDDAEVPKALNLRILNKRGIKIEYFGEGYKRHQGPRSRLGQAIQAAQLFIDDK